MLSHMSEINFVLKLVQHFVYYLFNPHFFFFFFMNVLSGFEKENSNKYQHQKSLAGFDTAGQEKKTKNKSTVTGKS